jgi:Lipase (class 3)
MKVSMVILTIIKIVIGLTIFIFFTVGLSSAILIANYTKAVKYTFYNRIECKDVDICIVDPSNFPIPDELTIQYSQKTAQFILDLVNRVVNSKGKDDVTGCTKLIEIYNNLDKYRSSAVIWESDTRIGSDYDKIIWIAIRGTDNIYEWINNFKISQVSYDSGKNKYTNMPTFMEQNEEIKVHTGFVNIYDQLYPDVMKILSKYDKTKVQVCLAGHSLGAAITTIFGAELSYLGFENVSVYTFGSPRVGNFEFINKLNLTNGLFIYRIVNTEDSAPEMPVAVSPNIFIYTEPFYYMHCGIELSFTENWKSLANNHCVMIYTEGLKRIIV